MQACHYLKIPSDNARLRPGFDSQQESFFFWFLPSFSTACIRARTFPDDVEEFFFLPSSKDATTEASSFASWLVGHGKTACERLYVDYDRLLAETELPSSCRDPAMLMPLCDDEAPTCMLFGNHKKDTRMIRGLTHGHAHATPKSNLVDLLRQRLSKTERRPGKGRRP